SEFVHFDDWTPRKAADLVVAEAGKVEPSPYIVDESVGAVLEDGLAEIMRRPGWANARDAHEMFKLVCTMRNARVGQGGQVGRITASDARLAVAEFLDRRPEARPHVSVVDTGGHI